MTKPILKQIKTIRETRLLYMNDITTEAAVSQINFKII